VTGGRNVTVDFLVDLLFDYRFFPTSIAFLTFSQPTRPAVCSCRRKLLPMILAVDGHVEPSLKTASSRMILLLKKLSSTTDRLLYLDHIVSDKIRPDKMSKGQ